MRNLKRKKTVEVVAKEYMPLNWTRVLGYEERGQERDKEERLRQALDWDGLTTFKICHKGELGWCV